MLEPGLAHHPAEAPHEKNFDPPNPYWRRAHTDWKFWVARFFLFAAIFLYVGTSDLSLVPSR